MEGVVAATDLVLRNAAGCVPALAARTIETCPLGHHIYSGAEAAQRRAPGRRSAPQHPSLKVAAAVVLRNARRLAPALQRAAGPVAAHRKTTRKSQAYGDGLIVRWRREQIAVLWRYLQSLPAGKRACTRDAVDVLEREGAAAGGSGGGGRSELLLGLGCGPRRVYARVQDKLKRMQRVAHHGMCPLDSAELSNRITGCRWPEWTAAALSQLPGGAGTLQQLSEVMAADPALAPYLDWRPDPNCRAVPRWRQQLKKTLSRLPCFVNTGVRAGDGTNCHVYRYDPQVMAGSVRRRRGSRGGGCDGGGGDGLQREANQPGGKPG